MTGIGSNWARAAARLAWAVGLVTAALAAGASAGASELRVAMGGDPDSLDPHKSTLIYARLVHQQTQMSLTILGADGAVEGGTAEDWSVSPDGLTYTFRLREGLAWSDGVPFGADDIVYSFRRMMAPDTLYPNAELFYWIENAVAVHREGHPPEELGVTARDDRTVVFRLASPNPFFPALLGTTFPAPRHAIERFGAAWTQPENYVSNGAYTLKARIPNNKIVLERNPDNLFGGEAGIDQIVIYPITEQTAATRRYLAGELDMVYSVTPSEFDRLKAARPPEAIAFPAFRASYITLNIRRPPLDDERVRRALSMSIERDVLTRLVGGAAVPQMRLLQDGWPGIAERSLPDWASLSRAQRLKAAKALLAEAGYGPGDPLRLEFIYSGEIRQKIAVALQGMLKEAGIRVDILSKEVQGLFSTLDAGDYQIGILAYDMGVDPDPHSLLAGFEPSGWAERSGFRSAVFDGHMAAARDLADMDARGRELADAETALVMSHAILPLYSEQAQWFISPRVKGWNPGAQPFYFRRLTLEEQ